MIKSKLNQKHGPASRFLSLAVATLPFIASQSFAQLSPPHPPLPPITQHAKANLSGKVKNYLLNPEGDADGFLMNDGTQVQFPPHLSKLVTDAVKLGDSVAIEGERESKSSVRAETITNEKSKKTIADHGPDERGPPPARNAALEEMKVSGKIEALLTGPGGETNGVLLGDNTVVRFPPNLLNEKQELNIGKKISASGYGTSNSLGKSIQATELKNQ